ncbi:sensor histidine kinase [Microbacterium dextranolyticum]|uniref:histidine kinase n=1 Tax=Microbacterium dextranolyticum TaxID=36806 RepID=A0A9W6HKY1_9MICO|nr:PAS domain-containing sensor histidine kinase [Microbacterium dextranolyticum]MBM7462070.1 signal transduction histidine kinase [Microbacterium dextranolyticum]GLJ94314.1 two-component sensor histidine kinase [Microbacterium dextranolyticum]
MMSHRWATADADWSRWDDSQLIGTIVRSVWQWQLVVAFSSVTVAVVIATLDPALFSDGWFLVGIMAVAALTVVTLVTPWARARPYALTLPIVDIFAIGCLANADHVLGYLWIVPIAWIATYYSSVAIVVALALIVGSQVTRWWLPGTDAAEPLEVIIVLLALGFLGVAMSQGTRRGRAYRRLIRRQSRQVDRAFARATVQERRAIALFDSIGTALAIVDGEGRLERTNAAYRSLYGLSEVDERHPGRAVEYAAYRGDVVPVDQTSLARAGRGERVRNEPLWLYDADGRWRALSLSIRGRTGAEPGTDGVSIIELDDVTVTEMGRRAQRAATSAVSHELRNPLTVIIGHADLLLDDDLTPAQREHAALIDGAAERMLVLIARLLDANRPVEVGDAFDLTTIATSAVEAFAPAAAAADVELTLDDDGRLQIVGDGFRMRQVVDNLMSNAIKYTPRGGAVHVTLRRDEGRAVLTVRDTGIGIAADDLENVFRPYFRARSATSVGISGTGLGMSIVRTIVEENHGTITLESSLGSGTTATVSLPLEGAAEGGAS